MSILKKKIKVIVLFPILTGIIFFYFFVDNNCLNLFKLAKSYHDLNFANIKVCKLSKPKEIVNQKLPFLYSFFSDLNRHYFSNYSRDILNINQIENYNQKEKELFYNVIDLKQKGIKGLVNTGEELISNKTPTNKYYYEYSRQNKDFSNTKFYKEVTLKKISKTNNPKLAWKHVSMNPNSNKKWQQTIEISPVYFNGKIFYISADFKLIAIDITNGKVLWQKELLHSPSRRGFIIERDKQNNENIYIGIESNIYKINAQNGDLIRTFGKNGSIVNAKTRFSPVIFENNLIIVTPYNVNAYDKDTGEKKYSIPFFKNKNFFGGLPWGGMALDEERGTVYFTTGNPRPKVYGVNRPGINEASNSLIAVNLLEKKVKWIFQETFHDLWNLDVAFPPIITTLEVKKKEFDVVIVLTKVGNFIMLERTSGKPIFDINLTKVPKSKISSEITSPYQIKINRPEPITKFEWSLSDMNKLDKKITNQIIKNLDDYDYGYFKPPLPNKSFIFLAEGPIWEGATINPEKNKLFSTVNHTPTMMKVYLKSLWPHSKVPKKFKKEANIYKSKCSSCHGSNRNGKYEAGTKPENIQIQTEFIPSLVGYTLFDELKNKLNDYENFKKKHKSSLLSSEDYSKLNAMFETWDKDLLKNKKIAVTELSTSFVDEKKNFISNYPQGEIVAYDLSSGKIDWRIPFGYEENKIMGTFNKGGLSLSNDGTLFATGTPDKKIFAYNSDNGEEIWSYDMDVAGTAPPIIYEYNNKKYLSVIATGGYHFKFPDRGSILYTFKLN